MIQNVNNKNTVQNYNSNTQKTQKVTPNVSFASIHEAIKSEKTEQTVSVQTTSVKQTSREEKIAALKSQVANGTYSVDTRQVAKKLVNNNLV